MKVNEAIGLISEITSGTGFVYVPSVVTNNITTAHRGVQVSEDLFGNLEVKINADGISLDRMKSAITSKVGDSVKFVDELKSQTNNEEGQTDVA